MEGQLIAAFLAEDRVLMIPTGNRLQGSYKEVECWLYREKRGGFNQPS